MARRDLVDLANRIALRLFHPRNEQPLADRLVLYQRDKDLGVDRDLGGWGLGPARNAILDVLRTKPRRPRMRRRGHRR